MQNLEPSFAPFTETLSWQLPADGGRLGALSDTADATTEMIRVAVMPRDASESDQRAAGGGDIGSVSVGAYTLTGHARSVREVPIGQECTLSKFGKVRIATKMIIGRSGNYARMTAEIVDGGG